MPRKQSEAAKLRLRFSEKLRSRIEAAATRNQRSMNAEIIHRLEQSFQIHDQLALAEATATAVVNKLRVVSFSDGKLELGRPEGGTDKHD
jgi:hypothetical protein